jgi:hypothetical protein
LKRFPSRLRLLPQWQAHAVRRLLWVVRRVQWVVRRVQ